MLFIVQFEDHPNVSELRKQLFDSHIEFLDNNRDRVLVPGALRTVPDDEPVGGLWIVDADDEAGVRALFENDPFWVNGLRARVQINRWQKAFPDREVTI